MAAGMTDYSGYSMEDMLAHLREWVVNTVDAIAQLEEVRGKLKIAELESNEPMDFCDACIAEFQKFVPEFERLIVELPKGVRPRHLEALRQLHQMAKLGDEACVQFKHDCLGALPSEDLRPVFDKLYAEARQQLVDYFDLDNMRHRLEALVLADSEPNKEGS
jgi:hypothetical protein